MRSSIVALSWWLGVAISAVLIVLAAANSDLSRLPPTSPFDNTDSGHAEQWRFLDQASRLVPDNETFTVRASDSPTEMSLYTMSVGLLPRSTGIPKTYYGKSVGTSASARFVLVFGAEPARDEDAGRTTPIDGGFVIDRGPSDQ